MLLVLTLAGCVRGPCDMVVDCGGFESTHAYVIRSLEVPPVAGATLEAVGHDLDGVIDDGSGPSCVNATDFVSPIGGEEGVDNQLAAHLAPWVERRGEGSLGELLRAQIVSGELLLVLWVTSNSLVHDAHVEVRALLASPSHGLVLHGGLLVPGQVFEERVRLGAAFGRIEPTAEGVAAGRLDVVLPTLPISFVVGGRTVTLTLRDVHLTADIDGDTLTNGELGGRFAATDLGPVDELLGCPSPCADPPSEWVAAPDLDPSADGATCRSVSAGLRFEAVAAAPPG